MNRVQILDDGTRRLEYRYIPWPLQYPNPLQINAALNETARRGTALDDLPGLDLPHDIAPEDELTDLGSILWQSLPVYAILSLQEPWISWKIFMPPGTDEEPSVTGETRDLSWEIRGGKLDTLMHLALPAFPNNRWATLHFKHLEQHVPAMPDGTPCVMGMSAPLSGPMPGEEEVEQADEEGWTRDVNLPRAHPIERVEYPNGLFKQLWFSLPNDQIEWARRWEEREPGIAKVVEGAIAVVLPGEEEFPWQEHFVLRLDIAARLAPSMFEFFRKYSIWHAASWSVRRIEPCYHEFEPQVTFQAYPEEGGYRAAAVLPKPFFTYDPDLIAGMEADIRKQWH